MKFVFYVVCVHTDTLRNISHLSFSFSFSFYFFIFILIFIFIYFQCAFASFGSYPKPFESHEYESLIIFCIEKKRFNFL